MKNLYEGNIYEKKEKLIRKKYAKVVLERNTLAVINRILMSKIIIQNSEKPRFLLN